MKQTIIDKITAVSVSGKFTAILDVLLDIPPRSNPSLVSLTFTSDGCLLGQQKGDIGFNDFLGARSDFDRNMNGVADVAELDADEKREFLAAGTRLHTFQKTRSK